MPDYTDSTNYPVYADSGGKALFLADMHTEIEQGCRNKERIWHIMQRFANTNVSGWDDPTVDGDFA